MLAQSWIGPALSEESAGSRCPITIVPKANAPWQKAARQVEAETAHIEDDCAYVVVTVLPFGGHVIFLTRDGRRAERDLGSVSELGATILALRTLESVSRSEPAPEAAAVTPSDHSKGAVVLSGTVITPQAMEHLAYGVSLGFRGNTELASPTVGGYGVLVLNPWSLGILGRYEAHYRPVQAGSQGLDSSAIALGVSAGRQDPISRGFAITSDLDFIIAAVHQTGTGSMMGGGQAEGRIGLRVGAVFPRKASPRLGVHAGGEHNLTPSARSSVTQTFGTPALPTWAISLVCSVEFGAR